MKVLSTKANLNKKNDVNFTGMTKKKDSYGLESYDFYLPYDSSKYNAFLEVTKLHKNDKLNYEKLDSSKLHTIPLEGQKITFTPDGYFGFNDDFGYRFKLVEIANTKNIEYHNDAGTEGSGYTVVDRKRAAHNKKGQMMHLMPDNHNVGWSFDVNGNLVKNTDTIDKAVKATRTHFNQMGGNIAGIVQNLDRMEEMGVRNILSTPIFGMDELSSHGYWTTNPYQVSTQNGTVEDFKKLQIELFKRNMNLIADGAFVNEGLEGIHFKHVLKWGDKSPYASWFKAFSLKDTPLTVGVIPNVEKDSPVLENIKLKVINAPYKYDFNYDAVDMAKNKEYDPSKPTMVQLYDDRLVDDEQRESNEVIRRYAKLNTDNQHDIMSHNDSVLLYAFEVDPSSLHKNIKRNSKQYDDKDNIDFYKAVLSFDNFSIGAKRDGGFYTWDGNIDIAKLNYMYSSQDEAIVSRLGLSQQEKEDIKQGGYQVQDYIQQVGSYWTKLTKDTLIDEAIKQFAGVEHKNLEGYKNFISESKVLPDNTKEVMTGNVISNVIKGDYDFGVKEAQRDNYIMSNLMDFPFESVEFAPDVTAVLVSPYITKRPFAKEDIGKSRMEMYSSSKDYSKMPKEYRKTFEAFDEVYTNEINSFANSVISEFGTQNPKLTLTTSDGKVTQEGEFLIPLITNDIMKFALVKALAPDAVSITDNKVKYDYGKLKETTVKKLKLSASSPQEEAQGMVKLLKKAIAGIDKSEVSNLAKTIALRYKGASLNDIKMAYALVDRTESGLNWRIDATKDVADIDYLRGDTTDFTTEWNKVIDFWKGFTNKVREENSNSYIIAEMTDVGHFAKYKDLAKDKNGNYLLNDKGEKYDNDYLSPEKHQGKYIDATDAEMKFLQETGMSTLSNYSFFFSSLPRLEGKYPEMQKDQRKKMGNISWIYGKIQDLVNSAPVNSAKHSHNFFSNHDKPRILHFLALDMELYTRPSLGDSSEYSNITLDQKVNSKRTIEDYLDADKIEYNDDGEALLGKMYVNMKALATATALDTAFIKVLENDNAYTDERSEKYLNTMKNYISGEYGDPDSFATKPFDKIIKESLLNAGFDALQASNYADKMIETMLTPAMEKYKRIFKVLTLLPGNPTMYSGDELGMTGFETPNKNIYVQNRNALDWRVLEGPENYITKFYDDIKEIGAIREKEGLSALSTGETLMCNTDGDEQSIALLRYDDKSTLLCVANESGTVDDHTQTPEFSAYTVKKINIPKVAGMKAGAQLKSALTKDGKIYQVQVENGNYFIEDVEMNDTIAVLKRIDDRPSDPVAFMGNANLLKAKAYIGSQMSSNTIEKVTLY